MPLAAVSSGLRLEQRCKLFLDLFQCFASGITSVLLNVRVCRAAPVHGFRVLDCSDCDSYRLDPLLNCSPIHTEILALTGVSVTVPAELRRIYMLVGFSTYINNCRCDGTG